ncbi:glycosyltransferase [Acinetobacter towneri]|uniref:glycosyltransferase family 2 protein n=1 Tax=Acinetobacter towneri TaxID=202956 RepID=UPI001F61A8B1|nr:glycosyltransferase family 2 protein [Acinetobacter towneri]UNT64589.1 glycosyltransferase [Acinetobacter towneri]
MFSVVIPLYNKELSIKNTIQSVLNQSYQNFEILIINDGSVDGSVDVVKNIKDERIRLIHQNNQGVSSARNKGIQEAKYEWIAFLDGDDLWESNHLEEIVKMMNIYPTEKVYVTSFEYSDHRRVYKHKRNNSIFKIENYFKEAMNEDLLWTSIVVVSKDCFKEVGFFNINYNRGEDLDLWSRFAKKFNIVKSIEITAIYRIDAENRTNLSKNLEKCYYYHLPIDNINQEDEKNYYILFLYNRVWEYLLNRDYKTAIKLLNKYPSLRIVDFIKFSLNFVYLVFFKKIKKVVFSMMQKLKMGIK